MTDVERQVRDQSRRSHSGRRTSRSTPADNTTPIAVAWSRSLVTVALQVTVAPRVTGGHLMGMPAVTAPVAFVVTGMGFVAGVPHGAVDRLTATRLTGDRLIVLVGPRTLPNHLRCPDR